MGISSKFFSILINLYNNAFISIKTSDGLTNSVKISQGVLQGEKLSPALFSLLLVDLKEFFRNEDFSGISIDFCHEILLLAYADDLVIFANTPYELRNLIYAVKRWCDLNGLTINVSKTKIIIFQKGNHSNNDVIAPSYLRNEKIDK